MNTESPFAHRIARTPKKPAKLPSITPPTEIHTPEPVAQAPAPTVPPAPAPVESSALRQAMIVLAAFVVTTLVLMSVALAWKILLAA